MKDKITIILDIVLIILWVISGVYELVVADSISKISYAVIWICLILTILTRLISNILDYKREKDWKE